MLTIDSLELRWLSRKSGRIEQVYARNLELFQVKDLFDRITQGGPWPELKSLVEKHEGCEVKPKSYTVQFTDVAVELFLTFEYITSNEVHTQEA